MLVGILSVPLIAYFMTGPENIVGILGDTGVA